MKDFHDWFLRFQRAGSCMRLPVNSSKRGFILFFFDSATLAGINFFFLIFCSYPQNLVSIMCDLFFPMQAFLQSLMRFWAHMLPAVLRKYGLWKTLKAPFLLPVDGCCSDEGPEPGSSAACPRDHLHFVGLGPAVTHRRTATIRSTGRGLQKKLQRSQGDGLLTSHHPRESVPQSLGRFAQPSAIAVAQVQQVAGPYPYPRQWDRVGPWILLC